MVLGGELLVRGASKLAISMGVTPLVVGLTVVAFGTSSPELVVSLKAALSGNANIAVGNVVGSNLFNILFILGMCALFMPLSVSPNLIRLDVPVMIGSSLIFYLMVLNQRLGRFEGVTLLILMIAYTGYLILQGRRGAAREEVESRLDVKNLIIHISFILTGLVLLVFGGDFLVDGAVQVAEGLGVTQTVIGLTIVAAGTSLPELVTSVIATYKGEREIAIGNIVGSNIYNILMILGTSSLISSRGLGVDPQMLEFDIPFMVVTSFFAFYIFYSGKRVSRVEGSFMLLMYIGYTLYLIL